jgi:hypothetical protein
MMMAAVLAALAVTSSRAQTSRWQPVADRLRSPAQDQKTYQRFNFPRRDLDVRIDGVAIQPGLALGGWVGFAGSPDAAELMGDLVVTAAELPAVVRSLAAGGLEVSAIHNHLVGESPEIVYVHVHGHGAAVTLASAVDAALGLTKTPRPVTPAAASAVTIDTSAIYRVLGARGRAAGSVANLTFSLVTDEVRLADGSIVPAFGLTSPINLQAIDGGGAVTTGDFAVPAGKAQAVIQRLAASGITPTAVHSHLIGERPNISYIHFWGKAPLDTLLAGLRSALDAAH